MGLFQAISQRSANSSEYGTPRIITLGGDHTTTLSALRSTFNHWGAVSVIHFDSHIGVFNPRETNDTDADNIIKRYLGSCSDRSVLSASLKVIVLTKPKVVESPTMRKLMSSSWCET